MKKKQLNLIFSLIPLLILILSTLIIVAMFNMPMVLSLTIGTITAAFISIFFFKFKYDDITKFISESISTIVPAILILLTIGLLASSFMYSGIVPSLMYYSLKLINPAVFLPAVAIVCAVVSISLGSSFTTIATIGLALFAAGTAMGFNPALVVGAIVSGSMFGDKLSPLSDTTNIAAMMAKTNLFTHVKNMLSDTFIAFIISLVLFAMLSVGVTGSTNTSELMTMIDETFVVSPFLALLPILLIVFTLFKIPVIPSILLMSLIALVVAVVVQPFEFTNILTGMFSKTSIIGEDAPENIQAFSGVFNRGGITTMQDTITIIFLATAFGGILRGSGMFDHILNSLEKLVSNAKSLIITSLLTAIFVAISSGEQYLSVMLPINTFSSKFEKLNVRNEHLSRAAEAGGTVVISLVPWGVVGVFISSIYSISAFDFTPFIFFAILTPFITIINVLLSKESKLLNEK